MSKRTKRAQAAIKRRRRKLASEIGAMTGWTKAARERGAELIAVRTNARARTCQARAGSLAQRHCMQSHATSTNKASRQLGATNGARSRLLA